MISVIGTNKKNAELVTSIAAVMTLELIGPSGSFAAFSGLSKGVMSLCMIVGRLEIFPILVLFSPSTWRRT